MKQKKKRKLKSCEDEQVTILWTNLAINTARDDRGISVLF